MIGNIFSFNFFQARKVCLQLLGFCLRSKLQFYAFTYHHEILLRILLLWWGVLSFIYTPQTPSAFLHEQFWLMILCIGLLVWRYETVLRLTLLGLVLCFQLLSIPSRVPFLLFFLRFLFRGIAPNLKWHIHTLYILWL